MKITFLGASRIVTGSSFLVETKKTKVLIDCGLFQGKSYCEDLNFEKFPYDPKSVEAVFITHAHIDHIGRLPKLCKEGFLGKIYSTPPTKDFAEFLLLDSEHVLKEESESRGKEQIYTIENVHKTMEKWHSVNYRTPFRVSDIEVEFYDAGHILGSSSIVLRSEGEAIVFSGDLGNINVPFLNPTEEIRGVSYAVLEATYGNRIHEGLDKRKEKLEDIIEETAKKKGVLLIPSFALERTQEMIFELNELVENGRIPKVPVFIDSPLAIHLTGIYKKYSEDKNYFNEEAISLIRKGDALFDFPGLHLTLTTEESKSINNIPPPKIIIAGSGMSHGGRILHHEKLYLSNKDNTILFIGFQAKDSLGRQILNKNGTVKIFHEDITVRARVESISGYSAHPDRDQLMNWLLPNKTSLKKVFLVHSEEEESEPFAQKIMDNLAISVDIPTIGDSVVI